MITEQEIIKNAFKEMQSNEESMAKKYAQLSNEITEPKLQAMLKGMEQGARNNYKILTQTMSKF